MQDGNKERIHQRAFVDPEADGDEMAVGKVSIGRVCRLSLVMHGAGNAGQHVFVEKHLEVVRFVDLPKDPDQNRAEQAWPVGTQPGPTGPVGTQFILQGQDK